MKRQDKVALITGSGRGIGAATARLMAAEGVIAVAAELEAEDHEAIATPTDVSDAAQVEAAIAQMVA